MIEHIKTLTIYVNSICNLKCRYCFIHKDPYLVKLDGLLEKTLETDYYYQKIEKDIANPEQIEKFEVWGGEPLLTIERLIPTYRKILNLCTSMDKFAVSSNFSVDNWYEKFKMLFDVYKEFPDRNFEIDCQISIDGPKEINDNSRGAGVTDKIIQNFDIVCKNIKNDLPNNVKVIFHTKSTISKDNFDLLDNRDYMIYYFKFFETFIKKVYDLNDERVQMFPAVYNLVCPFEYTKDDGIRFAKICKIAREITNHIEDEGIFQYYGNIIPFRFRGRKGYPDSPGYELTGGMCGSGYFSIGLMPDDFVCTCHRAFQNMLDVNPKFDFSHNRNDMVSEKCFTFDNSKFIMKQDNLYDYMNKISWYYSKGSRFLLSQYVILIRMLAQYGLIQSKYKDEEKALKAAKLLINCDAQCIHCNESETGSFTTVHTGEIKLFLNGALDYIYGEEI